MSKETAEIMREMRKRSGLSQREVAKRIGTRPTTSIGDWARGKFEPTFQHFAEYAEACGYMIHVRRRDGERGSD